jgi:hypothetical protein
MVIFFIGTVTSAGTIHIIAFSQSKASSRDLPGTPFCVPHGLPKTYWVVWVPILAFETFLLALAVRRAVVGGFVEAAEREWNSRSRSGGGRQRAWRERAQAPWMRTKYLAGLLVKTQRIVDILIRDSILYFLVYVPR